MGGWNDARKDQKRKKKKEKEKEKKRTESKATALRRTDWSTISKPREDTNANS